jgi:hypothetical protein
LLSFGCGCAKSTGSFWRERGADLMVVAELEKTGLPNDFENFITCSYKKTFVQVLIMKHYS